MPDSISKSSILTPNLAQPLYNLGKVLAKQEKWSEAIEAYRQALEISPHYKIYLALASALENQGEIPGAIECYSKVLELQPDLKEARQKLESLKHSTFQIQPSSSKTLPGSREVSATLEKAQACFDNREWDEAISLCERALKIKPEAAEIYALLGNVFYGKRELETAKNRYRKALELQPNLSDVRANLGSVYAELQQPEEAIECYRGSTQIDENQPRVYSNWGRLLLRLEQFEDAAGCYQKAIDLEPNFVKAHLGLAEAFSRQEAWGKAVECYRHLLTLEPDSIAAQTRLAKALHRQSQALLDESVGIYTEAIATKPYEVDLYHSALEVEPRNARLYFGLAKALEERGETAQAIVFYNLALGQDPDRTEEALAAYRRLMPDEPGTLKRKLSEAYANAGRVSLDKALNTYQRALELDPDNPQFYYQAIDANRSNARLYFGLANALWHRGDRGGAISAYLKGLKIDPDNAEAIARLDELFRQPGGEVGEVRENNNPIPDSLAIPQQDRSISDFDWTFYIESHDDLSHLSSFEEAYQHWLEIGKKEGRIATEEQFYATYGDRKSDLPADFNWCDYLELNPDLKSGIKSKWLAIRHFLAHGIQEGRLHSFNQLYYKTPEAQTQTEPQTQVKPSSNLSKQSSLDLDAEFDWRFYLEYNKDLSHLSTEEEARSHWLKFGKAEGRIASEAQFYEDHGFNPSLLPVDFDWQGYLDLHLDLKENISSKWRAIAHYLTIGRQEKRIYAIDQLHKGSQVASKSKIQIPATPVDASGVRRLAVFFHLYYFDLWEEIHGYIRNIPEEFDLYINIVESIWKPEMHDRLRQDFPNASIGISPNRGKDIGGHLASMERVDFSAYDLFCTIHTKKSPHVSHLISDRWRQDLFEAILGNPEKVQENLEIMRTDPSVGLIGSRYWRNIDVLNNADHYDRLLDVFEIKGNARECEYLSGTMMWVRPQIWKTMYDKFKNDDLEPGDGKDLNFQKDGQIAHSLERIIGNLVRHNGMRLFWQE